MDNVDLVIRGGTIYDGTGGVPFVADVAVDKGRIVEVGATRLTGTQEIDAQGLIVTPGWVDIHTHYDGQITWESRMQPSSSLGATTVLVGNCGVGFAPVRPADHDLLIRLMEGVEDIPGAALHEGLSWNWQTFPQYMEAVEAVPHDIDIGVQVPHGALRVYVMGERGAHRAVASEDEIAQMRALTAEALRAGALGFSTTRTMVHQTADGDPTPSYGAGDPEMLGIALALRDAGSGVMQVVSEFRDVDREFRLMRDLWKNSGRLVMFTVAQAEHKPSGWRDQLRRLEALVADGVNIKAQVAGRAVGLMLGLQGSVHPFISRPSFQPLLELPLHERVAAMSDPVFRQKLIAEQPLPGHPFINSIAGAHHKMFELGDPPNYEPDPADSMAARAKAQGVHPDELVYDALIADDGKAFLYFPMHNYAEGNLEAVREMLAHPDTISSLSDGGAHLGAICDVSLPTYMLTHWCRDRAERQGPQLDLSQVIRCQTMDTAWAIGLRDRGVLKPGFLADINVIDFEKLRLKPPYMLYDLPTGARRLTQEAEGYTATIKSGVVIYRAGKATGALPGKLVRGAQPEPQRA